MLNHWLLTGVLGLLCGIREIKDKSWNICAKGEEMSRVRDLILILYC